MNIDWLGITVEQLERGLIERFNVKPFLAQDQARDFAKLAEPLRADFIQFWKSGTGGTSIEVQGYTWEKLSNNYKMVPTGVWSTLDWLFREPQKASAALKRGYDFII